MSDESPINPEASEASAAANRESDPLLRERYGLGARREGLRSQRWFYPALITALLGGTWLAWSATHYSLPEIRHTLISYEVIDAGHIQLRYSVTFKSSDKGHLCQLVAKDFDTNVVGEVVDHFPIGTRSQTLITIIPTRVAAVNADISRCAVE